MYQCERAYAKIHLDRIEENMRAMHRNLSPGTSMIGVVKADAYGHGAVAAAKTIDPFVVGFATATIDEAIELRRHGIMKGILLLSPAPVSRYEELFQYQFRPAVFQLEKAERLSRLAVKRNETLKIHIAVDTGMSRIGFEPVRQSAREIRQIAGLPGIEIEGMFTHFARADEADKTSAREQLFRFCEFADMVKGEGVTIPILHCSNSAGIVDFPEANLDAVRAGITIYGLYPSDEVDKDRVPLKPAMELKSFITYIKEIAAGTPVGYGGTFVAENNMKIATISMGYGDGYPRGLSGKGAVLVCGKRAPILGRICMDQFMVDVTGIPEAEEGMEVTLLGRDGGQEITMEELAELSGGFHYELPCILGKRVPRVYYYHGRPVGMMTCFQSHYERISDET